MNWIILNSETQLAEINQNSFHRPQVIYKHSISCPTSSMAKIRLEKSSIPDNIDFYYLDVINHRPVSNKISNNFAVRHESPQVLLIKDGKCIYHDSHHKINMDTVVAEAI